MKRSITISVLFSGLLFMLAAFPVVAQVLDPAKIVINRKPLLDMHYEVLNKVERKDLDLAAAFDVQGTGKLTPEGKIDPSTFTFTKTSGDTQMTEIVKRSIQAVSDSGFLQYLAVTGGGEFSFSLSQDDRSFAAIIHTDLESPRRAQSVKIMLGMVLKLYKDKKSVAEADENDRDDLLLVNGASVAAEGKRITIKFEVEKEFAQAFLKKKLLSNVRKLAGLN